VLSALIAELCKVDKGTLKPIVIVPRKTIDLDLVTTGLASEKIQLFHQPKVYIDHNIFHDWLEPTFVPELQRRRQARHYDGPAVLMLDNCTAHTTLKFGEICGQYRITPVFLPPPSSNQLQILDFSLFGVTKRLIAPVNRMEGLTVQTTHVCDIVNAFFAAYTPMNIVKTFRNAGILLLRDETHEIISQITPETTRCVIERGGLLEPIEVLDEGEEEKEDDSDMTSGDIE
jgi:hypothetical protein